MVLGLENFHNFQYLAYLTPTFKSNHFLSIKLNFKIYSKENYTYRGIVCSNYEST